MKKGTIMLLLLMVMAVTFSCNDPYSELEKEEVTEQPMTGDDDNEEEKPSSSNGNSQTGG